MCFAVVHRKHEIHALNMHLLVAVKHYPPAVLTYIFNASLPSPTAYGLLYSADYIMTMITLRANFNFRNNKILYDTAQDRTWYNYSNNIIIITESSVGHLVPLVLCPCPGDYKLVPNAYKSTAMTCDCAEYMQGKLKWKSLDKRRSEASDLLLLLGQKNCCRFCLQTNRQDAN